MPRSKKFRRALQILCCAGARSKNQNGFSKIHFQISGIPQGLDLRTWCPELKRPVSEWKIIKIALKSRVLLWKSQPWDCALNLRPQFQKGSPPHLWVEIFWINMKNTFSTQQKAGHRVYYKKVPQKMDFQERPWWCTRAQTEESLTPLLGRGRRPTSSEGAGARARARAR